MRDRAILHSDANCFYASVETVLNPEFRGKAIAVCGAPEERHGIVLAKSEKAKRAGVKTGMANWQAKQCCRDLIIVPPQYDYYLKFSKLLHGIYRRYTDQVEPFGMDECWLDVTYSPGDPMEIAEEIRQAVKDELGLTVSIGVSFNKVFAKLGSDYKKPDAITQISKEHFKEIVWPLPCSDLLYCGNATTAKLGSMGVRTIGGIASLPVEVMQRKFGKNGVALWKYANGLDDSRVAHQDYTAPAKSVGHGITCVADLENMDEARKVIFALSLDIGYKLRYMNLRATGVQLYVRDSELSFCSWQKRLDMATQDEGTIALVFIKRVSIIGILSFQISHHPDEFAIVIPDVSFCPSHRGENNLVEFTVTTYQKLNIFFFCDESSDNGNNLFFCIEEAVDLAVTEEGHRENIKHARHHHFAFTDFEWTCFILIRSLLMFDPPHFSNSRDR